MRVWASALWIPAWTSKFLSHWAHRSQLECEDQLAEFDETHFRLILRTVPIKQKEGCRDWLSKKISLHATAAADLADLYMDKLGFSFGTDLFTN